MEQISFNKLLLKTAFSCMACDGDIDKRELDLIVNMHLNMKAFGEIDIHKELDNLVQEINLDGNKFLRKYFEELDASKITAEDELKLIKVSIDILKADDQVEYSEIKFFKVIRSKLKIDDESILADYPDFEEYLEQDIISESYLSQLQDDYFTIHKMPIFQPISSLNESLTDLINLDQKNE
jgi:hypothetical protein